MLTGARRVHGAGRACGRRVCRAAVEAVTVVFAAALAVQQGAPQGVRVERQYASSVGVTVGALRAVRAVGLEIVARSRTPPLPTPPHTYTAGATIVVSLHTPADRLSSLCVRACLNDDAHAPQRVWPNSTALHTTCCVHTGRVAQRRGGAPRTRAPRDSPLGVRLCFEIEPPRAPQTPAPRASGPGCVFGAAAAAGCACGTLHAPASLHTSDLIRVLNPMHNTLTCWRQN